MGLVPWADYQSLLTRYDALVLELVKLKREGFGPSVPLGEPTAVPELPVAVRQAIAERAEPHSRTYRQLVDQAWEMVALKVDEELIVKRILAGEPVEL